MATTEVAINVKRCRSFLRLIVDELAGRPVLTAPSVGKLLEISPPGANRAPQQLQERGIIKPLNEKKWGRAWEASELLSLVDAFERRVAGGRRAGN